MTKCVPKLCLETFDLAAQMQKLAEELSELIDAMTSIKPENGDAWTEFDNLISNILILDPDFINECADVLNVIKSLDCACDGKISQAAATKRLRTEIRINTGYYKK